jgi:cytochrome P450
MTTTSEPLSWRRSHRDPEDPINPAPEFARIRSEQPVFGVRRTLPNGDSRTMWLITKYADARDLLSSRETSNSLGRSGSAASQPGFLLSLDPPDQTRIRANADRTVLDAPAGCDAPVHRRDHDKISG